MSKDHSPIMVTTTSRLTRLVVALQMEDLLPGPEHRAVVAIGTDRDGPSSEAWRCECPLPSCHVCSCS